MGSRNAEYLGRRQTDLRHRSTTPALTNVRRPPKAPSTSYVNRGNFQYQTHGSALFEVHEARGAEDIDLGGWSRRSE